jgi:hypothetical protein
MTLLALRVLFFLLTALTALPLASTPSHALTFTFSFTNVTGNVSGTVSGEIFGLTDNATSAATAVQIENGPAGLGLSLPISVPLSSASGNAFTVASGVITDSFFNDHFSISSRDVILQFVSSSGAIIPGAVLLVGIPASNTVNAGFSPPTFAAVITTPLPAALPLFATGLGALGLLGWRRKRKTRAA